MTGSADRSAPQSDRWNLNVAAVIGVVAIALAAAGAWVVASGDGDSGGDDAGVPSGPSTVPPPDSITLPSDPPGSGSPATDVSSSSAPPTTSAQPMPSAPGSTTVASTTTAAPTTVPPAPATAAPAAGPDAVPGDLGVSGRPMQQPPCDGSFITIVASGVGSDVSAAGIEALLEEYPGSHYLRTDQTCASLSPSVGGQPIYVVYFGPFAFDSDACAARADGPADAYARRLSGEPGGGDVSC